MVNDDIILAGDDMGFPRKKAAKVKAAPLSKSDWQLFDDITAQQQQAARHARELKTLRRQLLRKIRRYYAAEQQLAKAHQQVTERLGQL